MMNFPTALTFVAGIGIAGAIALGVAPMASAAATNPVGGADPYVPAGTNPMVPYGPDAAQIYGDNPLGAHGADPPQVDGRSASNPEAPGPFVAGGAAPR